MHDIGVRGFFLDHAGLRDRAGWSELQAYLIYKLSADISRDPDALIVEFTDDQYGAAAPLIRQILGELEAARKAMNPLPFNVTYRSAEFNEAIFPYLTPANIHRWQTMFDEMETLTANEDARIRDNVKLARREFDAAALWRWLDLREEHPHYYTDYTVVVQRIQDASTTSPQPAPEWDTKNMNRNWASPRWGTGHTNHFATVIEAGGKEKPLPAQFADIDPERIQTLIPRRYRGGQQTQLDPEAAFGYATLIDGTSYPLPFGFHQMNTGERVHSHQLEKSQITPGEYRLYEIGEVEIMPGSRIYIGRSWQTRLELDELYEPGAENLWHAYISIKLDGEKYGGTGEQDVGLVDRVILVKLSDSQF